jgi:molybdate transport system substrate-binding protein
MRGIYGKVLLIAALVLASARVLAAGEILVFAAASLADALQEAAYQYGRATGERVVLNLGSSSILTRQIEEGTPADLFLSADEAKMDQLEKGRLVLRETRKSVLSNRLVIVVPSDSTLKIASPQDLALPAVRALALAEPQSVPAGIYARQYLVSKKLWRSVSGKVIPTENVRGALAAVEAGNADAGIVYKTDAGISKKVRIAYEVPAAEGPKISYPFAVLANSERKEAARKFLAYLESPPALEVFRRFGFLIQK